MNFSEKFGKTIEEAASLAAKDLDTTIDNVEIEVLEEPSKGFLGIGSRLAKVRVTRKKASNAEDVALEFLKDVSEKMGINLNITAKQDDNIVNVVISGPDSGTIIGKRGQTLDSIQYLTNLVVNKNSEKYLKVVIDAENYREKREATLEQLAIRLAGKVYKSRKPVRLEPMNPYERKVIHTTLQEDQRVKTRSEGEEPYRRVVVELRKDSEESINFEEE